MVKADPNPPQSTHPSAHPSTPTHTHTQAPDGRPYWYNAATGETSWQPPGGGPGPTLQLEGSSVELLQVQNAFKAVSTNSRTLTITLYLTGCKPEQLAPEANPKPGSTAELIKALQANAVCVSKSKQESSVWSGVPRYCIG